MNEVLVINSLCIDQRFYCNYTAMRQMIKQYGADQIRNVAVRKHLERLILFLLAYVALHGPHLKTRNTNSKTLKIQTLFFFKYLQNLNKFGTR